MFFTKGERNERSIETIAAIVISLGGGGAIIWAFSSWIGKIWADRMIKKYEFDSKYRLYSSQLQFDREYTIYSELWRQLITLKNQVFLLDPLLDCLPPKADKKRIVYQERYNEFVIRINNFSDSMYSNSPFINSEIYKELNLIYELCRNQGIDFETYKLESSIDERTSQEKRVYREKNQEIADKVDFITEELREYLKKYRI